MGSGTTPNPKDSFTYRHTLEATKPPTQTPFSRSTVRTLLRLTVGYPFVADYTKRFNVQKDWTLSDTLCQCGTGERSLTHTIYHCHLTNARYSWQIRSDGQDIYFGDLFSLTKRASRLLPFLQTVPALHKRARPPDALGTWVRDHIFSLILSPILQLHGCTFLKILEMFYDNLCQTESNTTNPT